VKFSVDRPEIIQKVISRISSEPSQNTSNVNARDVVKRSGVTPHRGVAVEDNNTPQSSDAVYSGDISNTGDIVQKVASIMPSTDHMASIVPSTTTDDLSRQSFYPAHLAPENAAHQPVQSQASADSAVSIQQDQATGANITTNVAGLSDMEVDSDVSCSELWYKVGSNNHSKLDLILILHWAQYEGQSPFR
jgi:hypothetical protein